MEQARKADVEKIGHYSVLEILGKGGMAVVYKAIQPSLNRLVAIKVLPPQFALNPEFVQRFEREAKAIAKLSHPNIIQIYDKGKEGDLYYFVMEYVNGQSLDGVMKKKKLGVDEVLDLALQVCRALQYAHQHKVVHRDMKPGNILIDEDNGVAKVSDFGIAQLTFEGIEVMTLTQTSVGLGTLNYMSPEQRRDARTVDKRTDLYSFGVILYEMLTGKVPMGHFQLPSQANKTVPKELDIIVLKCLKDNPDERYQEAKEIEEALVKIRQHLGAKAGFQQAVGAAYGATKEAMGEAAKLAGRVFEKTTPAVSQFFNGLFRGRLFGLQKWIMLLALILGLCLLATLGYHLRARFLCYKAQCEAALETTGQLPYKAANLYRKVSEEYSLDPFLADGAQLALARLYEQYGKRTEALAEYKKFLARFPRSHKMDEALFRYASLLEGGKRSFLLFATKDVENLAKARELYLRLLDRFPASPYARQAIEPLAQIQRDLKDYEAAIFYYRMLIQKVPEKATFAFAQIAEIYKNNLKNLPKAKETYYLLLEREKDPNRLQSIRRELDDIEKKLAKQELKENG